MSSIVDDLGAGVAELVTVIDSAEQLLTNLSALLTTALANATPVAAVQAVIDTINAKKVELAEAVVANTPAA